MRYQVWWGGAGRGGARRGEARQDKAMLKGRKEGRKEVS